MPLSAVRRKRKKESIARAVAAAVPPPPPLSSAPRSPAYPEAQAGTSNSARQPTVTAAHNVDYAGDFPEEHCVGMWGGADEY